MRIAAASCGFYQRPGALSRWKYRSLKFSYRGPSLFLSKMRDAGHAVELLSCDEEMKDIDFSVGRIHERADLFYLSTHGVFAANGYEACLHLTDWIPSVTGLGSTDTSVIVFDTCFLIDSSKKWQSLWGAAAFGNQLRLMLGFDNLAALDRGSSMRGRAFAENLIKGMTFKDAWFAAVSSTTATYNKAIAIGIGDSQADALQILNTASLSSMPGPRAGHNPCFELRP